MNATRHRATGLIAGVMLALTAVTPALAAASCSFDAGSVEVAIEAQSAVLDVDIIGEIRLDGVACGGSVTSTDTVVVAGTSGSAEEIVIDIARPFAPGATPEPTGVSEIEISVAVEGDPGDALTIQGGGSDDVITAGADGIDLTADDDVDVTATGTGTVRLRGGDGGDVLRGDGAGMHGTSPGPLVLEGNGGDDMLIGSAGDDVLVGGEGDDALDGGPGSDRMGGGDGDDTVSYARAPIGIRANLEHRRAGGWGDDVLLDLEHLIGSARNDRLVGTGGPSRIDGGLGRDRISGGAGDDLLIGGKGRDFIRPGPGDDVVLGGAGADTFTLRAASRKVRIDLRRGVANGQGKDRMRSIEKAVGSRFDDVIRGSKGNNHRLVGARGDDLIIGLAGNDRLRGGPGDDVLRGGPGDDELDGGPGDDVLIGGPGRDRLRGSPGNDVRRG